MRVASVWDLVALVNVLAGDAVACVAQRTSAALEGAIREAGALCSGETWVGKAAVWRKKKNQVFTR